MYYRSLVSLEAIGFTIIQLTVLASLMVFCVFFPSYYLPRNFCTFRLDKERAWIGKLAETEID